MSEEVEVLVGELLEGDVVAGKEIRKIIAQDLNKATLFFSALEGYCKQENKIATDAMDAYKDLQTGLVTALSGDHSDEVKADILRMIEKIIDSINNSVSTDDKRKKFNKYLIIGGLAVGAVVAYKNPKAAKSLLDKVVKMI